MEKIVNLRELGGIITQQGMRIKPHKLFRSGNPSVANESDTQRLRQMKIDEVIDFRSEGEKKQEEHWFGKSFNWVAQPVFTGDLSGVLGHDLSRSLAVDTMCDIYRRFPTEFQKQFHYFLSQAEQGKTLLYHCTAGKDRTGFATLLLLSALGVSFEQILDDYLYSNHAVAGLKAQLSAFIASGIDEDALLAVLEVYPEYLDNALHVINKEYGGVERYLSKTLAVDVNAIRAHYLEE